MISLHVGEKRRLQRRVDKFVHAKCTEERIRPHARDQLRSATDQPSLRSAEQFIAAVSNDIDSAAQTIQHARLTDDSNRAQIEKRAAAQIFHQRNVPLARQSHQFSSRGLLGETSDLKVRPVYAQQQSGAIGDGALVVPDARAIRGANLTQDRARLGHHVRNAKRSADLHQFAARDNYFSALGYCVQREQYGRRIVVDHDGGDRRMLSASYFFV